MSYHLLYGSRTVYVCMLICICWTVWTLYFNFLDFDTLFRWFIRNAFIAFDRLLLIFLFFVFFFWGKGRWAFQGDNSLAYKLPLLFNSFILLFLDVPLVNKFFYNFTNTHNIERIVTSFVGVVPISISFNGINFSELGLDNFNCGT